MTEPLAGWLAAQRWFRAKGRPIAAVAEFDRADLGDGALVVLEVAYADDGLADRYLTVDGDGAWAAIVRAMGQEADLRGRVGRFACRTRRDLALDDVGEARLLAVEQSNTSVVIGERLILKLYRLLDPGENPDVEVSAFLTRAGFDETPALAGTMTYEHGDGARAAAGMLQEFVPSTGDGWAAMLGALGANPGAAIDLAAEIGAVTARLHAALASAPDDPAFPVRAATAADTGAWRASAEAQLAGAAGAVSGAAHDRLVAVAPAVSARFADAFGHATGDEVVTRVHGDYHLGQLLARAEGGFSVIDFEGEPARPLAERRRPGSPLRDVAGMLRSLDYAARTAQRDAGLDAEAWLPRGRDAFLATVGVSGPLLDAFELEKACYEVRYEANNRPEWLWLPLAAVERLAGAMG